MGTDGRDTSHCNGGHGVCRLDNWLAGRCHCSCNWADGGRLVDTKRLVSTYEWWRSVRETIHFSGQYLVG